MSGGASNEMVCSGSKGQKKNKQKNSRPILRKIMVVAILLARGQRDMLKTIFGEQ